MIIFKPMREINLISASLAFATTLIFHFPLVAAQEDLSARRLYSEKARSRAYDGGIDEQSLVVQQNLSEPRTDGSELVLQKKILGSGEDQSGGESAPAGSNDETSSGF
jgi:hypothetical protein